MQLNELIEENSIETIANRTRIPVDMIEMLVKKDFSKIKRVKALGFISILEREFSMKLDSLREDCLSYYPLKDNDDLEASTIVKHMDLDVGSNKSYKKLFVILLLLIASAGAWYFLSYGDVYHSMNNNGNIVKDSTKDVNKSEKQKVEKQKAKKQKSKKQKVEVKKIDIKKIKKNLKPIPIFAKDKTKMVDNNDTNSQGTENTDSEAKIIDNIKQEQKQISKDSNTAQEVNYDNLPAIEPDKVVKEKKASTAKEAPINKNMKNNKKETKKKDVKKNISVASKVILHPTRKLWVGYVNLDTMERSTNVITKDMTFAPSKKGWIVVTGHNGMKFISGEKSISSKVNGKDYFLIEGNSVNEITKVKFQKLNKSKVW